MRDFEIVAIVLVLFLGFGIAMGVLIVSVLPYRKASEYPEGDREESPPPEPEEDERPPWWRDG